MECISDWVSKFQRSPQLITFKYIYVSFIWTIKSLLSLPKGFPLALNLMNIPDKYLGKVPYDVPVFSLNWSAHLTLFDGWLPEFVTWAMSHQRGKTYPYVCLWSYMICPYSKDSRNLKCTINQNKQRCHAVRCLFSLPSIRSSRFVSLPSTLQGKTARFPIRLRFQGSSHATYFSGPSEWRKCGPGGAPTACGWGRGAHEDGQPSSLRGGSFSAPIHSW